MKIIKKITSLFTAFTLLGGATVLSVPDRRYIPVNAETEDTDFDGFEINATTNANFNSEDLIATQKYLLGSDYNGKGKVIDINGDGVIDVFDLVMLRSSCPKTGNFFQLCSEMIYDNDVNKSAQSSGIGKNRIILKATKPMDFSEYTEANIIESIDNGIDNIYIVQFSNEELAENFMSDMQERIIDNADTSDGEKDIIYAEFDRYLSASETYDDGMVTASSSRTANSWGVSLIEADKYAEYLASQYNSEITVAVIDSGVSPHGFIGDRLLEGYDLVDNDKRAYDASGHGTHVAGTIVDCTPNLNVKILPVRVLNQLERGAILNIGNGILYAVKNGADVINLSFSSGRGGYSKYVDDAISYAVKNGVAVVIASGNHNDDTKFYCPENSMESIVVGAIDKDSTIWEDPYSLGGSNYGESVDLVAPGVDIESCALNGAYRKDTGTSMAAPHISAAAAMIKYANPSATPAEVEKILKDCCQSKTNPDNMNVYGSGIPQLSRLIPKTVVPSVTLSKNEIEMCVGYVDTVSASATPAEQNIVWESSDEDVVKIINGNRIKGVGAGTATVTASIEYDGKIYKSECEVTITSPSVEIDKTSMNLIIGNQETINATAFPNNSVILYSTSDPNVATVDNYGVVTAMGEGTAEITAKIIYGNKPYLKSCTVNVIPDPSGIKLDTQKLNLYKGADYVLILQGAPKDSTVTWKSSDENVVTVNSRGSSKFGTVEFKGKGNATVSATVNVMGVDYTFECNVTADIPTIEVLKVDPIYMGENYYRVIAWTTPKTECMVSYVSDNKSIVTVDGEGRITPVHAGKTKIRVYSVYGDYICSGSCDIEILPIDKY